MKIAIFHNLPKGGALVSVENIVENLSKKNELDLYSFNSNLQKKYFKNYTVINLKATYNAFEHINQVVFELRNANRIFANIINDKNYDLVLVFPCTFTQSPYILRYLKSKCPIVYFFTEPKREFYENTSYDYFSIKRLCTRLLRSPIKFIDITNCSRAKYIIANSVYTSFLLKKIYKKNSFVVYPGLKQIQSKEISITNNKKIFSVGLFSKIKGHHFSILQIKNTKTILKVMGRITSDFFFLKQMSLRNKVTLKVLNNSDDREKNNFFKKNTIFLANQEKEPFGITTLEAARYNCLVLGKNDGGTPEIIMNGVNGILYPCNLKLASLIYRKTIERNKIIIVKTCTIDWENYTNKVLQIYHYLKNEPAE